MLQVCPELPVDSEAGFRAAFCVVLLCVQTELFLCGLSSTCSLRKLGTVRYYFVSHLNL